MRLFLSWLYFQEICTVEITLISDTELVSNFCFYPLNDLRNIFDIWIYLIQEKDVSPVHVSEKSDCPYYFMPACPEENISPLSRWATFKTFSQTFPRRVRTNGVAVMSKLQKVWKHFAVVLDPDSQIFCFPNVRRSQYFRWCRENVTQRSHFQLFSL